MHYIWYDKLYFKEDNAKKKTRLLHRLEKGKPEPNVYILALPESRERNILDIYSSLELMQPHYKNRSKYVVGIARGKQDAIELASSIVGDMYNTNGGVVVAVFKNTVMHIEDYRNCTSCDCGHCAVDSMSAVVCPDTI